ncbi:hypothetical protein [Jiangella asiatica]|uniref:Uncharacterized protein n=1 Tax=Jiangella asiatica TaxID=2530372 RepID=A0A4V2Z2Z1_9ACTN|nr:hypothetical protein [Jiangella asiatica]TDE10658.1 hypothetical protein E1269_11330 [Jiangella asiatica]
MSRARRGPDILVIRHPTRPRFTIIGSEATTIARAVAGDVWSRSWLLGGAVLDNRHWPAVVAYCELHHLLLVVKSSDEESEAEGEPAGRRAVRRRRRSETEPRRRGAAPPAAASAPSASPDRFAGSGPTKEEHDHG